MSSDNPTELTVLGRILGTHTGWDLADTDSFQFYDFLPADGVVIPATDCLFVDFSKGLYEAYFGDDIGARGDLIDALKDLPRSEAIASL